MADSEKNIDKKEIPSEASPASKTSESPRSPRELGESRQNIAGALEAGENGTEFSEGNETVKESISEGKEQKGDGSSQKKKDDSKQGDDDDSGSSTTFTFDEGNLPPAPKMIQLIEKQLRSDIHKLEKQAKQYKGGLLRKSNFPKYSETMIELRERNVLLKRLVHMAGDALKKLFLKMFRVQ